MGRSVGADHSGAVDHQNDRKILERNFLEQMVIRPLKKRAVYIDDRPHPGLGKPGRRYDRVRLANADIKEPVGKKTADRLQHGPLRHGGGQNTKAFILAHQTVDRVARPMSIGMGARHIRIRIVGKHFGGGSARRCPVLFRADRPRFGNRDRIGFPSVCGRLGRFALRRVMTHQVRARRMVSRRIQLGVAVPVPLFGKDVQKNRLAELPDHRQIPAQERNVVSVNRPDIPKPELFKKHSPGNPCFNAVFQAGNEISGTGPDRRNSVDRAADSILNFFIHRVQAEPVKVKPQTPDPPADRHFIVVQDDGKRVFQPPRQIERFKNNPAGQRAVADHRKRVTVLFRPENRVGKRKPERRTDTAPGMPGHEQVERAFFRIRIPHQAAERADRRELPIPAGQDFVRVTLMPRIPHQPVFRKIKRRMKRDRQFHHAEIRREMNAPFFGKTAEKHPDFAGQPDKIRLGHLFQIVRSGNRL